MGRSDGVKVRSLTDASCSELGYLGADIPPARGDLGSSVISAYLRHSPSAV